MAFGEKGTGGFPIPKEVLDKEKIERLVPKPLGKLNPIEPKDKLEVEEKLIYSSGASRSEPVLRFDYLPRTFLERVAKRFMLGAVTHGEFDYRKSFVDDFYFIRDIGNHLQQHWQAYLNPKNSKEEKDDNLAAIGWAIAVLMEYEEYVNESTNNK